MAEKRKSKKPLSPRKLRKRAKDALSIGRWIAKRRSRRLEPVLLSELRAANEAVAAALRARDVPAIEHHGERLAELIQGKLRPYKPNEVWQYAKGILLFGGIAAVLRIVVFELFSIPSGSMLPTLQVGDRVVVNKASFGLRVPFTYHPPRKVWRGRKPRYGEVVVFLHPEIPEREMVKRVIAVEGDTVRFVDGRVAIRRKGEKDFVPIPRTAKGEHEYCDRGPVDPEERCRRVSDDWKRCTAEAFEERHGEATYITLGASRPPPDGFKQALENTRKRTNQKVEATENTFGPIPEGHVFMLGDNREHSEDSRYWGTVPYDYLEGPALFDLFSYGGQREKGCETGVRWGRFFKPID